MFMLVTHPPLTGLIYLVAAAFVVDRIQVIVYMKNWGEGRIGLVVLNYDIRAQGDSMELPCYSSMLFAAVVAFP